MSEVFEVRSARTYVVSIIHMAVGPTHTTMSSSSTTATDRHPTETRTTTNDNDVMAQRGSNYFFGFLITFIILFLIFVGCGIASRRRLLRARGENALVGDPWGMLRPNVEQKRPTFYDYPLASPTKVDHWEKIMVSEQHCLEHLKTDLIHPLLSSISPAFRLGISPTPDPATYMLSFFCSLYLQRCGRATLRRLWMKLLTARGRFRPQTPILKLPLMGTRHPTASFPDLPSSSGWPGGGIHQSPRKKPMTRPKR